MGPLIWESRPEGLRNPAIVCAFTGWNDAGDAASAAVRFFGASVGAFRIAHIDPEEFYDFQETRPRIEVTDGSTREICWPTIEVYAAHLPDADRDLILLSGPEPNNRWRTFAGLIIEMAEQFGASLAITVGALLADVPHSRPVAISGIASDERLVERLDVLTTSYEGPTGITGVVHAACHERGLPSASLWASVPHYVAAAPNPKAALALVRKLEVLVGHEVDACELEDATADYERQISLAVQSDPDVMEFVERLERAAEEQDEHAAAEAASRAMADPIDPLQLPDGDVLASEFQRFLRQQGS